VSSKLYKMVHSFAGIFSGGGAFPGGQASIRTRGGGVNGRAVHGGVQNTGKKAGPCLLVIALSAHAYARSQWPKDVTCQKRVHAAFAGATVPVGGSAS
jgi:hypothetical protein